MSKQTDQNTQSEQRTDLAEDRTMLANERTFAGWMRTGLAAVAMGLGFEAVFGKLEPTWVPKSIATLFILIALFIFWLAQHKACKLHNRLHSHKVDPVPTTDIHWIAGIFAFGAAALGVAIWFMNWN